MAQSSDRLATTKHQVSQNRLAHLVDILPSGVIILDGYGLVEEANKMALSFFSHNIIGQKWFSVINQFIEPRADDGHEVSLKDGRRLKIATSSLAPEDGQLIVLTDLTETRQLQNNMAHMQRLSALGKMVASLAHQVRTPLAAAMLYAANLKSKAMTEQSRARFNDKLIARLKYLESQVNDMLMFARGENGQTANEHSLQELLSEVKESSDAMLSQHKANLMVTLPEPDLLILGNRSALSGAITNLIQNAIQAKSSGLLMHLVARRFGDKEVEITLVDNGPGISNEQQKKIFEPFFTTKSQGTGLGLAVVQSVAKSHNGKLHLVSQIGKGSSFSIILPLQREAAAVIMHAVGS